MDTQKTSPLNLLGDASASSSGCGCGGGCTCGHGAAEAAETGAVGHGAAEATTSSSAVETELLVTGMTCGHCVASVTEEVGSVAGVDAVNVELNKGGASRVTVRSAGPIDEAAIRAAVEEAGYQLA